MLDIKKKFNSKTGRFVQRVAPFLFSSLAIIALMFLGSRQKELAAETNDPIISAINDSSFVVTADQLSESYIVADLANSVSLPSMYTINENYASIVMKYELTGSTTDEEIITKPNIIDPSSLARGVITHIVAEGETLDSIVEKHSNGATATQIRWSNNLKTATLSVGQTIYIPPVSGILYTVKSGDTVASLAEKYKSNIEEIIIRNDLEEASDLNIGATIILPAGELPETERPEYVAPAPKPTYSVSRVSDSGIRYNTVEVNSRSYWSSTYSNLRWQGNPGVYGNCTWYAWHWRRNNMGTNYHLPGGAIGNAGTWTYMSWSRSYLINKTPAYGAVIQTSTGSPGHVGVVVGVVSGSHIVIEEMNFHGSCGGGRCGYNRVFRSHIKWSDALRYNYIHAKY